MKILFYTEPHGLRDSFTAHKMPYDYFRRMAREINFGEAPIYDGTEARVFSNHFVSTIEFDAHYADWPAIIQPTVQEQIRIEDLSKIWMGPGIRDWVSLMTEPNSEIVKFYTGMITRIHKAVFDFDVIACWGENMAVREAARAVGARTVFFELASMRAPFPKAVLIDPVGVNGSASTVNLSIDTVKAAMRSVPLELMPMLINEEFSKGSQNVNLPRMIFNTLNDEVRSFFDGDQPKALVPLQLADDANQLLYSDFDTVAAFANAAIEPLLASGFKVVVKPHPHAKLRGGYVIHQQNNVLKQFSGRENVLALPLDADHDQYVALLKAVDLIVTNNSSTGFEGIVLGKPTVTLGRSCYSFKDGLPTLEEGIRAVFDKELDARFAENRAAIATYMLACAFPLERSLGAELIKRLKIWNKHDIATSDAWLAETVDSLAWDTWHQCAFMRDVSRKSS